MASSRSSAHQKYLVIAAVWMLLVSTLVQACQYRLNDRRDETVDGIAAVNLGRNRLHQRRMAKSPVDRASSSRRRRRRLTFNGFFMNKFLNFANLFDFWSIIPEAKPRSIPEAIKSASKRIVEIMDDQEGLDAKFVRLSFHDCVGGCDGCVDLNNPENFGLEQPIDALDSVVRRNAEFLTTADVWALAGLVASQERQNDNSQADFGLQLVQRPDCVGGGTKAGPSRTMPSAHLTTRGLLEFFNATFGFNSRETVAIMGGHTLGVANSENSGFDGPGGWGPGQDQLNNNYYTELLDNGQVSANFELEFQDNTEFPPFPNQFFWQENDRGNTFMFNADMALAVDMAGFLDPVTGNVNCTLRPVTTGKPTCPASSLLGIAQEYAQGNAVWVRDYRDAFVKMINTGCGNGICITVPTD